MGLEDLKVHHFRLGHPLAGGHQLRSAVLGGTPSLPGLGRGFEIALWLEEQTLNEVGNRRIGRLRCFFLSFSVWKIDGVGALHLSPGCA